MTLSKTGSSSKILSPTNSSSQIQGQKKQRLQLALKCHKTKEVIFGDKRLLLITGDFLVKEWFLTSSTASQARYTLHTLFSSGDRDPSFLDKYGYQIEEHQNVVCSHKELCQIAQLPTRQNAPLSILIEASPIPLFDFNAFSHEQHLPGLILDGIQDPGNVGTLIRSAESFGFKSVIALDGTCDLESPKVFSAARGSHFRLHLAKGQRNQFQESFFSESVTNNTLTNQVTVIAASCKGREADFDTTMNTLKNKPFFLVTGHESRGISPFIEDAPRTNCIKIPIHPQVDSLNVAIAGSILMHRLSCMTTTPRGKHFDR